MLILNGHIYSPGAPEVTLLNRSFRYGDGLFEDLRVWDGHILFLEDHLERLIEGMKVLRYKFSDVEFKALIQHELKRAIEVNQLSTHGRLSLHVYRGGSGGLTPLDNQPLYLIEAYSLKENYYENYTTASILLYKDFPLHFSNLSKFKTANSLPYVLAANFARTQGFEEALLMSNGYVSQASNHHLFIVKDRKIFTPPLKSACWDGIMRKHIMLICKELKFTCTEKELKPSRLKSADELFLVNTIRGIVAVNQLGDKKLDDRSYTIVPFLQNSLLRYVKGKYGI